MTMVTVRLMGTTEAEVRMVEAMYENAKGRLVFGSGMANEFQATIGLRKGSALSLLMFVLVMKLINSYCSAA